jgi:hypothetical protein
MENMLVHHKITGRKIRVKKVRKHTITGYLLNDDGSIAQTDAGMVSGHTYDHVVVCLKRNVSLSI